MDDPVREFRLEEFKQLKTEVLKLSDMLASLTQWMVAGVAALIAWLLTNGFGIDEHGRCLLIPGSPLYWAWWLPLGIVAAFAVIAFLVAWRMKHFGGYLSHLEKYLGNCGTIGKFFYGWEEYFSTRSAVITRVYAFVFVLLALLSFATAWEAHSYMDSGAVNDAGSLQACKAPKKESS